MLHNLTSAAPISGLNLQLQGRLVACSELGGVEIQSMFDLLSRNFMGVIPEVFLRDLEEKNWVILIEDQEGKLRGFTTFLMVQSQVTKMPTTVVSSGDTIVDPLAWGSPILPRTWIRSIYELKQNFPEGDLVWLLLTSGFRTYRFMSVFCREFFPRFDRDSPEEIQNLLRALAKEKYAKTFDAESGLVRFPKPQALRDHLIHIPEGRKADPHIEFFLRSNPGHAKGDELVSLAFLSLDNLTSAGKRMVR